MRSFAAKSFTLIELLVVCAIISVLMTMLLPAISKTKDKARQSMCAGNLKQAGLGIMMYSSDFDGCLMPGYGHNLPDGGYEWWAYDLYALGYAKSFQAFQCPSTLPWVRVQNTLTWGVHYGVRRGAGFCTYSANWNVSGAIMSDGTHRDSTFLKTVSMPSRLSLVMDGFLSAQYPDGKWTVCNCYGVGGASISVDMIGFWHTSGANIAFGDGHVEWRGKDSVIGHADLLMP